MPITIKDFKLGLFPSQEGQSPTRIIVYDFLKKNKENAYTAKELVEKIPELKLSQIRSGLTGLKQKDLISQKHFYWAYALKEGDIQ